MKTMFVGAIACCLLFFACKKNDNPVEKPVTPPPPDQKKVAVTFDASGFTQETTDLMARAADSMAGNVQYFWYLAYDSYKREISRQFQKASMGSGFGIIKDSLPLGGPYTIVMFAAPVNLEFNGPDTLGHSDPRKLPVKLPLDSAFLSFRVVRWYATKETFFKKFSISLNGDSIAPIATLNRIVGKVEVNVLDAELMKNINVRVDKESGYYFFNTGQCEAPYSEDIPVTNGQIITSFTRVTPTKFERFFLNNRTPMNVIIEATDGSGKHFERRIPFSNQWNKKVVITGRLIGPEVDPNFGFKVSLNTDWDADSTQLVF